MNDTGARNTESGDTLLLKIREKQYFWFLPDLTYLYQCSVAEE